MERQELQLFLYNYIECKLCKCRRYHFWNLPTEFHNLKNTITSLFFIVNQYFPSLEPLFIEETNQTILLIIKFFLLVANLQKSIFGLNGSVIWTTRISVFYFLGDFGDILSYQSFIWLRLFLKQPKIFKIILFCVKLSHHVSYHSNIFSKKILSGDVRVPRQVALWGRLHRSKELRGRNINWQDAKRIRQITWSFFSANSEVHARYASI